MMVMARFATFCVVAACLLAMGCRGSSATPNPTVSSLFKPTSGALTGREDEAAGSPQPQTAPVTIALVPSALEVRRSEEFTVDVEVDPSGRGISGVQVQLGYDSYALRAIDVDAGPLLGVEPVEVEPIIDQEKGTIVYAAARIRRTQPPTSPGVFAILRFQVRESASVGQQTSLKITDVKIPDEHIQMIGDVQVGDPLRLSISR